MAAANNRQPAGIPIHNTRFVRFVMPQTLTFCITDGPDVQDHERL